LQLEEQEKQNPQKQVLHEEMWLSQCQDFAPAEGAESRGDTDIIEG
jgi:hypothetical protein